MRTIDSVNLSNYNILQILPQYHFGSIHIRYDMQAMFMRLRGLNFMTPDPNLAAKHKGKPNWYRDYVQRNSVRSASYCVSLKKCEYNDEYESKYTQFS